MIIQLRSEPARSLRALLLIAPVVVVVFSLVAAAWAKLETWRQEGPGAFAKAHREHVVVTDNGRVRLGHAVSPAGTLGAERVWALVRGRDGSIYAATGDNGKVFRREPKPDALWAVAFDSTESQILSLAVDSTGTVYAGTGPNGQVVNLSDARHPASRPGPKVQYIWALAVDSQGSLLAATGPDGQLWKRPAGGPWTLLYDSKAAHLLCLAIGPDESVYAGSDTDGLIYRVSRDGKASILFDAPQAEVRALLWGGDGALYAGTAAEVRRWNDGTRVVVCHADGVAVAAGGRPRARPRTGHADARWRRRRPLGRRGAGARPACSGEAARAPAPGRGRLGGAAAEHAGRQRCVSLRRRRCAARGAQAQGFGARTGLGRRPALGRHRARGSALRGRRPRPRDQRPLPSSITARSWRSWPSPMDEC